MNDPQVAEIVRNLRESGAADEAKKAAGKGDDVVPPDVLESDEALYDYWLAQGRPSYRTFAEKVGMKKSTVGERILKARKAHGEA